MNQDLLESETLDENNNDKIPYELINATIQKVIDYSIDLNSKDLLQKFIDEVEDLTNSKIGFFHFVDEDQDAVILQIWSTNTMNNMCKAQEIEGSNLHYPISQGGVWVDSIRLRKAIIHNDYPKLPHKKGLPKGHAPVLRELVIPIFRQKKVVAVFGVGNKPTPYTQQDLKLASVLANQAWETIKRKLDDEEIKRNHKQYQNFIHLSRESIEKYELLEPMSLFLPIHEQFLWLKNNLVLTECNAAFLKMYNFTSPNEILKQKIKDVFDQNTLDSKISRIINKDYFWQKLEETESLKDGTIIHVLSNLSSVIELNYLKSIWITKIDISDKKRIEKEVEHVQRMESLGIVAGGLAHDFNNILVGILGNVELMKLDQTNIDLQKRTIENIERAVTRGRDITNQLFNFTRKSEPKITLQNISNIIDSSVKLALPGSKSSCSIKIEEDLPRINVDVGQINQVLTNLLINADQAMKGGKILIRAKLIDISKSINLKPGNYILISVKDNGPGIPEEIQNKIFTPFYSTKENGLGLGLASCLSIVKNHEGYIEFESELGIGTEFKVYLPVSFKSYKEENVQIIPKPIKKGRILLLDDDETVLVILKNFLEQLGQEVKITQSSKEAINLYKEALDSDSAFDLVFLDLIIPGDLDGILVANEIRKFDKKAFCIICTGTLNAKEYLEYEKYGFVNRLSKPFSFGELCDVLSRSFSR